jgi:hypothetical protein
VPFGPHHRSAMHKRALIMDTLESVAVDHMRFMIGEKHCQAAAAAP